MSNLDKLYVLTYNEVQIAGYRIFKTYEEALKEFIKHCILETKDLLSDYDDSKTDSSKENDGESNSGDDKESEDYDSMSCIFEIQELQGPEFITVREYDYDVFQSFIEDKDDIVNYLDDLEKKIDEDGVIPEELLKLFH